MKMCADDQILNCLKKTEKSTKYHIILVQGHFPMFSPPNTFELYMM